MEGVSSHPRPHSKRLMLWLTGSCFPKRVPQHLPLVQSWALLSGPGSGSGAHWRWAATGEGPHAGPGRTLQRRTHRCFLSLGTHGNGPKSFRETPVYCRVSCQPRTPAGVSVPRPRACAHTSHARCPYCKLSFTMSSPVSRSI